MGVNYHTADTKEVLFDDRVFKTDRKFNTSELYGSDFDLDSTLYDDGDFTLVPCHKGTPCEDCGRLAKHLDCIVIAVDGACRGNGTSNAQSAIGVYFAEDSPHNISMTTPNISQTSQCAELLACLNALTKIDVLKHELEDGLSQVVIKADSKYLVKEMTDWVLKWRENGYKTAQGSPVINADLFKSIDRMVGKLNNASPRVEVLFWHVPRAKNQEADGLANAAFGSIQSLSQDFFETLEW